MQLPDGNVMVVGGASLFAYPCDLWDPVASAWSSCGKSTVGRLGGEPFELSSGKIALTGGRDTDLADPYDPTAKTWSTAKAPFVMNRARADQLVDGRLLFATGDGKTLFFDGATETFETGPDTVFVHASTIYRDPPKPVALADGRALVIGGWDTPRASELYTPPAVACPTGTCAKGTCVDGYCCECPCTGQCDACDVTGREGYCSIVTGEAPNGARPACDPFATCYGGACLVTCKLPGDCVTGSTCIEGACVPKLANGKACALGSDCVSGIRVDGVCCDKMFLGWAALDGGDVDLAERDAEAAVGIVVVASFDRRPSRSERGCGSRAVASAMRSPRRRWPRASRSRAVITRSRACGGSTPDGAQPPSQVSSFTTTFPSFHAIEPLSWSVHTG